MTANRQPLMEEWRPIPGFPGYEVSDLGRVRSYWRRGQAELADEPVLLKLSRIGRAGHLCVGLREGGDATRFRTKRVHTLVLEVFVGPRPPGMECRHLDGDPTNNVPANLQWGTRRENADDRVRHAATPTRYCTWGHDLGALGSRFRRCPTCEEANRPIRCGLRHPSYLKSEAIEHRGRMLCPRCHQALMMLGE